MVVWKGHLSFGTLDIPISLQKAKKKSPLHIKYLDERDHAPIGYSFTNKVTGEEVPWKRVVKGHEYEKNKFIIFQEKNHLLQKSRGSQSKRKSKRAEAIKIENFINFSEIDPVLFEKPYFIIPRPHGERAYHGD